MRLLPLRALTGLFTLGLALAAAPAARAQAPGSVVITEVLANPGGTISDANGEWVELYNATNLPIDLKDWFVRDSAASGLRPHHKISSRLVIPAYGFVVLGNTTNTTNNGGVTVNYAYGASMSLANSLDGVQVIAPDSITVIDRVRYASAAISAQNGISRELRNVTFNNANMDDANWADALVTSVYGPGGRGTPGVAGQTGGMGTLPVELAGFAVALDGRRAHVAWTTAAETNNAGFQIEHRAPGAADFRRIAFVPGHGTTLEAHAYAYPVDGLGAGRHTFRLRQVDVDGASALSPEVEVDVAAETPFGLSAARPNPALTGTRFALHTDVATRVRVAVYDALGREVALLLDGDVEAGALRTLSVDASALASGAYVVRAQAGARVSTQTFSVLH